VTVDMIYKRAIASLCLVLGTLLGVMMSKEGQTRNVSALLACTDLTGCSGNANCATSGTFQECKLRCTDGSWIQCGGS
jgi:hypothetical protein